MIPLVIQIARHSVGLMLHMLYGIDVGDAVRYRHTLLSILVDAVATMVTGGLMLLVNSCC